MKVKKMPCISKCLDDVNSWIDYTLSWEKVINNNPEKGKIICMVPTPHFKGWIHGVNGNMYLCTSAILMVTDFFNILVVLILPLQVKNEIFTKDPTH